MRRLDERDSMDVAIEDLDPRTPVLVASSALTGYMVGATAGTLVGGWLADRARRSLTRLMDDVLGSEARQR